MKTPDQIKTEVLRYLELRFGLSPDEFENHRLYLASRERVYIGPRSVMDDRKLVTVGILIARASSSIKPTTNLLQLFGARIKKSVITLDREQAIAFAKGNDIPITDPQDATDGYVLLKYQDISMGCGLLKAGNLKNMLPKAKRLDVKYL
jgi:NOL1/NOP2/fmu family ribosome biogenesis protein